MNKRSVGAILGAGLLAGCVTDGGGFGGGGFGDGGSGVRWSGPASQDPFARSPYSLGGWGGSGSSGGQTIRPRPGVVCDRATETCYRSRDIDASETRAVFGRSAAREVDRIRDAAGTNRIYRVDNKVVCDRRTKTCYKNGHPDNSETKDFFGRNLRR
jgi:hypothetical protein